MQQTKTDLFHDYHLAVDSFNSKDYSAFFRNIRPSIELISQFLIFDFLNNDKRARDIINGDAYFEKDKVNYSYSICSYQAKYPPTGRVFCELFPKAYYCAHRDVTDKNASDAKKRIKRGLDSCSAELCRYYSIASELGSHAGRSVLDIAIQAQSCAAFFMGFWDYIKSNNIVSRSAVPFLDNLDRFVFGDSDKMAGYQSQIEVLIKASEAKEAALLTAQKMQLEAEQSKLLSEQRTSEVERRNHELEEQIRQLQEKIDRQGVLVDLHKTDDLEETASGSPSNTSGQTDNVQLETDFRPPIRVVLQNANNWDVKDESLDDDQLDLIEYNDNKSMIVAGCAGSGKSVIAMHKAEQLHKAGKDVILIAYTRSLSRFMSNGSGDSSFKFYHYHYWKHKLGMMKADYIIVDEIQDFTKEEIQGFIEAARKHFLFFGDTAQSIYRQYGKQTLTIAEIAELTGLTVLLLYNNYRLPRPIAKITQNYVGVNVQPYKEKVYKSEVLDLPHIVHFESEEKQLGALMDLVKDNTGRNIGILLPSNPDVIRVSKEFQDNNIECEFKFNNGDKDYDYVDNLNFYSVLPKIMTYHSAKGLQFDIVVLPFYNGARDDDSRKALYVAMTRTMKSLYIMYSTPSLLAPLNSVPSHLYLKEL